MPGRNLVPLRPKKSFQMLEHLGGGQLVQESMLTSTASFLFSLGGRKFLLVQNPDSSCAGVERGSRAGLVSRLAAWGLPWTWS